MPDGEAWTADRYVRFLRGTLAVLGAAEPAIARTLPGFARTGGESRIERLRRDLAALGDPADAAARPIDADLAARPAAFGAAYVIEGSLLGGQHVARAIEHDLREAGVRFAYLRPAGVAIGPRWTAFVAALDEFGEAATPGEWRTAEASAAATFDAFAAAYRHEGLIR